MKKIVRFSFLLLLIINRDIQAQGSVYGIEGTVRQGEVALPDAGVLLFIKNTQHSLKMEITDEKGRFAFQNIPAGEYEIKIQYLGFATYVSETIPVTDESLDLGQIQLQPESKEIQEVTVTHKIPSFERTHEGYVLNVENTLLAEGNTVLELLEKTPGLSVTSNEQIKMNGKSSVQIMIDGKLLYMDGQQLATYLKSLPANQVSQIRLIQRPSARYDAAGQSGLVDIRMKKNKALGTHGNLSLTAGKGRYFRTSPGISLSHNSRNWQISGQYNYAYNEAFNQLDLERNFYTQGIFTAAYLQNNFLFFPRNNQVGNLGTEYAFNDKWKIGMQFNGYKSKFNPTGENVSLVFNSSRVPESKFTTSNRSSDFWWNGAGNLYLKHDIDHKGREWTIDFDMANYGNATDQLFTTRYYDLHNSKIAPDYILAGDLNGKLSVAAFKSDLIYPLKNSLKLETGIKASWVYANNKILFWDQSNDPVMFDSSKSNHFIFDENINAVYLMASYPTPKYEIQCGLRAEHTYTKGQQLVYDSVNTVKYLQFFPSANFVLHLTDKNDLSFGINRRIDRPSYEQLNPFKFFLDPSTFKVGNPYLLPQLTWNAELAYTLLQKYTIQLNASRTFQNITQVIIPEENNQTTTIQTDKNLSEFDYVGLTVHAPIQWLKNWSSQWNFTSYYGFYKGNLANTPLHEGRLAYQFNSNHQIKLKQNWNAECNVVYNSASLYAYLTIKPTYSVQLGVSKRFYENRAQIKLSLQDIFYGLRINGISEFKDYYETFHVERETRIAVLSFSYMFGNKEGQILRKREGGAEEEKRRAGRV